jgi:hypothetical protein
VNNIRNATQNGEQINVAQAKLIMNKFKKNGSFNSAAFSGVMKPEMFTPGALQYIKNYGGGGSTQPPPLPPNKKSALNRFRNMTGGVVAARRFNGGPPKPSSGLLNRFRKVTRGVIAARRFNGGSTPPLVPPLPPRPSAVGGVIAATSGTAPPQVAAPTKPGLFTRLFGKSKSTYDILSEIAGGGTNNRNAKIYKMKQVLRTAKNRKSTLNRLLTNGKINASQHKNLMNEITSSVPAPVAPAPVAPAPGRSLMNRLGNLSKGVASKILSSNTLEKQIRNVLNSTNGQNKTEVIKSILNRNRSNTNTKRNTIQKIHGSGNGKMTNTQKKALINHLNSGAPPAPTQVPAPVAQSSVKTTIFGGSNSNSELNGILKRTNITNSSKSSLILDYARRNPERIKRMIDSVSRSTNMGKYDKEYLIEDLLRLQRKAENSRRRRGRRNNNRNNYYNERERYANSPYYNRNRGSIFGSNRGRNVRFNTRIPITNRGGNNRGRGLGNNRGNFGGLGGGNSRGGNFGGLGGGGGVNGGGLGGGNLGGQTTNLGGLGNNRGGGNLGGQTTNLGFGNNQGGLVKLNNSTTRGLNMNLFAPQNTSTTTTIKRRARPVRMKLLRQTVDNVKKTKLVKQIKKLGKKEGLGLINGKKNKLVKYIVKQIRPPYKKKKSKKSVQAPPVKENRQLLFKNTLVAGNYGATNQGLRPGNVPGNQRNVAGNRPKTFVP